ncbi:MAG TPA: hypothetical protein VMV08_01500 [Gaiellaceae bacterium]|nr:hypothetical protein [Gaiellaceae bacterium]
MAETLDTNPRSPDPTPQEEARADQELVMFLEPDQLDADTSVPVPRAVLNRRVTSGLWALRVFVILVSIMVIYTFASKL